MTCGTIGTNKIININFYEGRETNRDSNRQRTTPPPVNHRDVANPVAPRTSERTTTIMLVVGSKRSNTYFHMLVQSLTKTTNSVIYDGRWYSYSKWTLLTSHDTILLVNPMASQMSLLLVKFYS